MRYEYGHEMDTIDSGDGPFQVCTLCGAFFAGDVLSEMPQYFPSCREARAQALRT